MNDYAEGYGLTRDRMTFLWDQYLNGNADDNNHNYRSNKRDIFLDLG